VRISLALPQYEVDRDPEGDSAVGAALRLARRAEAAALDGVWVSDHPFAVAPDGSVSGALEPLVLLGALARATSRVDVGTLVLAATMRSPGLVAHTARAIAASAPGRLVVGVGTGWYEEEHRAFGVTLPRYAERVALAENVLEALAELGPDRPSTLVGGTGTRLMDVAARRADGWNVSWDVTPEGFALLSTRLDEACERAGRDPSTIRRSAGLTVLVGANDRGIDAAVDRLRARAPFLSGVDRETLASRIVVGTPPACAERIASYGVDEVVVALLLRDDPEMLDLFAGEVAPALRA
jgi:alkanesulfonate monooxygenase SsuD/methylene tetrahydromethanopterin reductase-like flavin-dependent oxidoreductase (luciferase family)